LGSDGERLRAGRIFINVGGRALARPMPSINDPYLTNSSIMDVDFLPNHLISVGGSYIGLDRGRRVQAATSAVIFTQGGPNGRNG
jgi:pyruvate/2-oxoglutarate dehydrogenase complex dihydrolipoamide dehydrogenase (E3) component